MVSPLVGATVVAAWAGAAVVESVVCAIETVKLADETAIEVINVFMVVVETNELLVHPNERFIRLIRNDQCYLS